MATMVPPFIDRAVANRGELAVFERLSQDPGTKEWIVLHSLTLAEHVEQIEGEIDFVVIVPGEGVLCLEVKGSSEGKLRRDPDGRWFFGYPNEKGSLRSPFKQARDGMYSLRNAIDRANPVAGVLFGSGAVFPFSRFNQQSPEWHEWEHIDSEEYRSRSLSSLLVGMLRSWRAHAIATTGGRWLAPGAPTADQCDELRQFLRGRFELPLDPMTRSRRVQEEAARFTQEQFEALDAMEENPRVIFSGPAGVGKTFLALEGTRRAAMQRRRVLLVCFNRLLGEWLEKQAAQLDGNITVGTIHSAMMKAANPGPVPVGATGAYWEATLPELACDKLLAGEGPAPYDQVFIDEAQDVLKRPYLDFLDLSLSGGLAAGTWRMFGDFERQAIYGSNGMTLAEFKEQRGGAPVTYTLRKNCRNTPEVAQWVKLLTALDPGYSDVRRPSVGQRPELAFFSTPDEQERLLLNALDVLWIEGYRSRQIVVLSPKADGLSAASRLKPGPWRDRLQPYPMTQKGGVPYCTIQSFKGLEAEAVVVSDLEVITTDYGRSLLYVALTRPLDRLVLLASEGVRGEMIRELGLS